MNRAVLCSALTLTVLAWAASAHATVQRFDFNTYEYSNVGQDAYGQVPNDVMAGRAQAFIAAHYPAQSSADAAIADFRHAGAACRRDRRASDHTICNYALPSHGMTALIGSAVWRIDVYSAAPDQVTSIVVSRRLAAD